MKIRKQIEIILGRHIEDNGYKSAFTSEDKDGRMDSRTVHEILAVVLQELERLENGQENIN